MGKVGTVKLATVTIVTVMFLTVWLMLQKQLGPLQVRKLNPKQAITRFFDKRAQVGTAQGDLSPMPRAHNWVHAAGHRPTSSWACCARSACRHGPA